MPPSLSLSLLLAVCLLTLGRVELDAVLPAPAGVVDVGRGGGDHPVVVVDLLQRIHESSLVDQIWVFGFESKFGRFVQNYSHIHFNVPQFWPAKSELISRY